MDEELNGAKKPPTILIADDDPGVVTHIREMVQLFGYNRAYTNNPDHILPILFEKKVDLILLDYHFEDRTGLEVMETIQKDPELASIPIIFLTGETDEMVLARCLEKGASDYLTKPVKSIELRARINACLMINFERQRYRNLLLHVVPNELSKAFLCQKDFVSEAHQQITVVSLQLTDFEKNLENADPFEVMALIQDYFTKFDKIVERHRLKVVRISRCSYSFVGGLYHEGSSQAWDCFEAAMEIRESVLSRIKEAGSEEGLLNVRMGIHTGPAISAYISGHRLEQNIWGPAASVSQQMQALCDPGKIRISTETEILLPKQSFRFREELVDFDNRLRFRTYVVD